MPKHPAVKEEWQCPICKRSFVSEKASGAHMRIHNNDDQPKETEAMFTVDVVALITRITKLEEDARELRAELREAKKELTSQIEDVQQSVFDQIPVIKDGTLVIEASEDTDTVFAHLKPLEVVPGKGDE